MQHEMSLIVQDARTKSLYFYFYFIRIILSCMIFIDLKFVDSSALFYKRTPELCNCYVVLESICLLLVLAWCRYCVTLRLGNTLVGVVGATDREGVRERNRQTDSQTDR